MKNKKGLKITLISIIFVLLITLTYVILEKDRLFSKTTYMRGFPEEDSPALVAYMQDHYNSHSYPIVKKENGIIYSDYFDINHEILTKSYYFLNNGVLKENYAPVRTENDKSYLFWELAQKENLDRVIEQIEDLAEYDLPSIEFKEHQYLLLETKAMHIEVDLKEMADKQTFDLLKKTDQRVDIDLVSMENETYMIELIEYANEGHEQFVYYLFVDGASETYELVEGTKESFEPWLASETNNNFKAAFPKADEDAGHLLLREYADVFDNDRKEIVNFHQPDYLSRRGDFVYLNGHKDSLQFGKQEIQTIDDYLQGNDTVYAAFTLSHSQIKKLAEVSRMASLNDMKIVYFDKDYIVYTLSHSLFIGNFESFNFIVDLQDDKNNPAVYVEYLGDTSRKWE